MESFKSGTLTRLDQASKLTYPGGVAVRLVFEQFDPGNTNGDDVPLGKETIAFRVVRSLAEVLLAVDLYT